ncbi:MAG: hypothetical protein JST91_03230 [Actinobacteria bacterium]|nr:hypothetical protein [Actinomycetota bacterium]
MSQPAATAPAFRRIAIERYAIELNGQTIGEVAKARSVNHRGQVSKPVWIATAEVAHPFGVRHVRDLRGRTRRDATARAINAHNHLCATLVLDLCRIDEQRRAAAQSPYMRALKGNNR